MLVKGLIFIAFIIFLVFSLILFSRNFTKSELQNYKLFYKDETIPDRLNIEISSDRNSRTILLTRALHNKVVASVDTAFQNITRDIDLVFLFNVSDYEASPYGGHARALPLFEFPFFLFSAIFFIRYWDFLKKKYFFLIPLILVSLILCGLFLPIYQPIKLIPLILCIQTITFFGIVECIRKVLCSRK